MKKLIFAVSTSLLFLGCAETEPRVAEKPTESKTTISEKEKETVAAHTVDREAKITNTAPPLPNVKPSKDKKKWTKSGDPIDTTKFDESIAKAEAALKANPNDSAVKSVAAEAYYLRGFALTEARQYAAAIGDYRKSLKYMPNHEGSKKWVSQITMIYKSLNREVPAEGEEPGALEFKKQKA